MRAATEWLLALTVKGPLVKQFPEPPSVVLLPAETFAHWRGATLILEWRSARTGNGLILFIYEQTHFKTRQPENISLCGLHNGLRMRCGGYRQRLGRYADS